MSSNYLSAIQNWFGAGYYGRHLGLILREIGNRHPRAIVSFISSACDIPMRELKKVRFETEYRFRGKKGSRIADLAILTGDGDDVLPRVLVEIKYYDKPLPATEAKPAQLEDYAAWQQGDPTRRVLMLSRECHCSNGIAIRRWSELARHLRAYCSKSDLIAMLVSYLEEEGIVMQRVDPHKLSKYFKSLTFGNFGAGMMAKNIEGPAEFSKLLRNIQLVASTFHHHFHDAWSHHNIHVPAVDFKVHQRLRSPGKKEAYVIEEEYLDNRLRNGGVIEAYARYSLGHGPAYLRIRIGLWVRVTGDALEVNPPDTYLFVDARGGSLGGESGEYARDKKIKYSHVTELAEAKTEYIELHAGSLLLKLISDIRTKAKTRLTQEQREALRRLSHALRKERGAA